jgi:hypothetical protein
MEDKKLNDEIVEETDDHISVCLGDAQWTLPDGRFILEEDFKVAGEVWRVHKNDPDPIPSRPHAHCIGGAARFVGCKLHLGTAELFSDKNKPLGRLLDKKQFARLIELIAPKFPDIALPLDC